MGTNTSLCYWEFGDREEKEVSQHTKNIKDPESKIHNPTCSLNLFYYYSFLITHCCTLF